MSVFRRRLMMDEHYQYIHFKDPEVERICLENFDYDKDGRISLQDARTVEDFRKVFVGNKNIKSLDDLVYFTGLKKLYAEFEKCSSVKSLSLPVNPSLRFSGSFCYMYHSGIETLNIPEGVQFIGNTCFMGALKKDIVITVPSTVVSIYNSAFAWSSPKCFVFLGKKPFDIIRGFDYRISEKCPAYVPDDSVEEYQQKADLFEFMVTEVLPMSAYPG